MKAEIGFVHADDGVLTERMQLRVEPQSETEQTLIAVFARRIGLKPSIYGEIYIVEAAK